MSRWGKNIVVPLDSLCKEKENTNRPTVARSVGTVGKWGKMGFTSTRTYSLTALPPAVAAAAAAAATAASAGESPASLLDDDLSPSVPEPPKPKKFFKSRNTAPPEVIAQMIQQLPRLSTSPVRDLGPSPMAAPPSVLGTPTHARDAIKLKIPKSNSAERKKKSSPKKAAAAATKAAPATSEEAEEAAATAPPKPAPDTPAKPAKKKKEEKKLKPEAPPSRIIARARKTVNYAEYDDDDRMPTPVKDLVAPKAKLAEEPPPPENAASKTPEHPPIVLRISKGTSRLVSTDSDEQALPNSAALPTHYSPHPNDLEPEHAAGAAGDFEATAGGNTPKIIVKPPRPPSPEPALPEPLQSQPTSDLLLNAGSYSSEINYSTVKISPDKPPKERLKLIIKGDVIRNAIAAAAAAEAAKAAAKTPEHSAGGGNPAADGVRPEKEKKTKSKKHKHTKHDVPPGGNQLRPTTVAAATACGEFKTPSPHLALGGSGAVACHTADTALNDRTIISPPALSERDFDSQSSVLGSISSKGNSTPHLAPAANEESCVVHSRGSSVITSDLETSQHSSLVAPPSDIESRLESMMMDDEVTQRPLTLATQEPLQEDILAVLQGDESRQAPETAKVNGGSPAVADGAQEPNGSSRRVTRGRNRGAKTVNYSDEPEEPAKGTRTRGKKQAAVAATPVVATAEEPTVTKRTRGRGAKKAEEETPMETGAAANGPEASVAGDSQALASSEPSAEEAEGLAKQVAAPRRGRLARNVGNNNNLNNNNINKIAANLSAKAGAAVEALTATPGVAAAAAVAAPAAPAKTEPAPTAATTQPRIYGRKRKNQQVMHLVPTASDEPDEEPEPARKVANLQDETDANMLGSSAACPGERGDYENGPHPALEHHATTTTTARAPSVTPSSPPPQRDYKVKDKFKRTLTLDNQANNCNAMVVATSSAAAAAVVTHDSKLCDSEEQQRDPVKLLISKKKGSIFKSRALPVQSEQAPSAKRHLYKHRWDAEANGGISNEASATPASANDAPAPSAVADNIFDDEAGAAAGTMRDNSSPTLGKLTRVVKPNPQVYANPFDMDEEMGDHHQRQGGPQGEGLLHGGAQREDRPPDPGDRRVPGDGRRRRVHTGRPAAAQPHTHALPVRPAAGHQVHDGSVPDAREGPRRGGQVLQGPGRCQQRPQPGPVHLRHNVHTVAGGPQHGPGPRLAGADDEPARVRDEGHALGSRQLRAQPAEGARAVRGDEGPGQGHPPEHGLHYGGHAGHGDAAVADLEAGRRVVQGRAARTGRPRAHHQDHLRLLPAHHGGQRAGGGRVESVAHRQHPDGGALHAGARECDPDERGKPKVHAHLRSGGGHRDVVHPVRAVRPRAAAPPDDGVECARQPRRGGARAAHTADEGADEPDAHLQSGPVDGGRHAGQTDGGHRDELQSADADHPVHSGPQCLRAQHVVPAASDQSHDAHDAEPHNCDEFLCPLGGRQPTQRSTRQSDGCASHHGLLLQMRRVGQARRKEHRCVFGQHGEEQEEARRSGRDGEQFTAKGWPPHGAHVEGQLCWHTGRSPDHRQRGVRSDSAHPPARQRIQGDHSRPGEVPHVHEPDSEFRGDGCGAHQVDQETDRLLQEARPAARDERLQRLRPSAQPGEAQFAQLGRRERRQRAGRAVATRLQDVQSEIILFRFSVRVTRLG